MMSVDAVKKATLFLTGFCVYLSIEVCWKGYSYPLMGIISGIAVLILDRLNNEISWDLDLVWQCLFGSCLITGFELVIGEIAKRTTLLPIMWDYTNVPLNFDGVICLPFSIVWMLLSSVAIFLADAINYYIFEDTDVPYYILFGRYRFEFKRKKCDEVKL